MPDSKNNRPGHRPEFEVAWYTKELGKTLQREMLQKQLARFSTNTSKAAESEDAPSPGDTEPPLEQPAG
jgi:hypothetical protein